MNNLKLVALTIISSIALFGCDLNKDEKVDKLTVNENNYHNPKMINNNCFDENIDFEI